MHPFSYYARTLIVLLSFLPVIFNCTKKKTIPRKSEKTGEVPVQEFIGETSLIMADSGRTQWILNSTHMYKKRENGITIAEPVEFIYYGGKSKPQSHVTAEHGETVGSEFSSFYVEGKVYVRSEKGYRLRTDHLRWDKKQNKITSDAFVRFTTRQGDVLTGTGFVSDADLDNWEILHNVKGEFHEFEKRMDEGGI